jgi:hypothetical protein
MGLLSETERSFLERRFTELIDAVIKLNANLEALSESILEIADFCQSVDHAKRVEHACGGGL